MEVSADSAPMQHDDGSLSLDGEVTLTELADDHGIVNADVTTIAGVVLAATSTLPTIGTVVATGPHELVVEEMRGRKITRIRVSTHQDGGLARPPTVGRWVRP